MASRTEAKAFQADLAKFAESLREEIEAKVSGFEPSAKAAEQRREQAARDLGFFARTYFPHYVSGDPSILHEYLFDRLPRLVRQRGRRLALAAPRGEAKSTICSQIFVLWCVVHGLVHYVPIIMDSFDQAAQMLEAIKAELEANPRLRTDFPEAIGQGRVWNAGVAITANDIKLQAFGSGKKLRGLRHGPYRPDLVVLDDIENDENVQSPEQRDKLERWLTKAVLKLGPPDGSLTVLYIGTILHYDSVLARTLKKPTWESRTFKAILRWPDRMDLWGTWEERLRNEGEDAAAAYYKRHKAEMDQGAEVSWPSKRPLVRLMADRAEDTSAFDSEYQNDPISTEDAPFGTIHFWVQEDPEWMFFGAVDPSLGRLGKQRDPAAILVGGYSRRHKVLDVVEAQVARMLPSLIIEKVIEFQRKYKCIAWAFESVQFQEFLRQVLIDKGMERRVPIPAIPVIPSTDKDLRIMSLQPHVLNGRIRLHASQTTLLQQLRHWPKADHDDGPDALEMLFNIAVARACDWDYTPVPKAGVSGIKRQKGCL